MKNIVTNHARPALASAILIICAVGFGAGCSTSPKTEQPGAATAAPKSSAPPAGARTVDAPKLNVGDVWVDRIRGQDREFKIVGRTDDGAYRVSFWGSEMITDANLNSEVYRSLTNDGAAPSKSSKPVPWFRFPMYEGQTWEEDFTWQTMDAAPVVGKSIMTGKVIGWQDVTVPAGKFQTLVVEVSNRAFGKGGAMDAMHMTYWYAPEVNRFVKFDFASNYEGTVEAELVAYHPAHASR